MGVGEGDRGGEGGGGGSFFNNVLGHEKKLDSASTLLDVLAPDEPDMDQYSSWTTPEAEQHSGGHRKWPSAAVDHFISTAAGTAAARSLVMSVDAKCFRQRPAEYFCMASSLTVTSLNPKAIIVWFLVKTQLIFPSL